MKISASFVDAFAREIHNLLRHVQVRVEEGDLSVVVMLLCDTG